MRMACRMKVFFPYLNAMKRSRGWSIDKLKEKVIRL